MSNYNSMKDGFPAPFRGRRKVYPSIGNRPGQIWPGLSVYVRAPLTGVLGNPGLALVVRGFPPVCVR